jgi:ADP-ribose pyrophosphatase YjhB (NUDIX family)
MAARYTSVIDLHLILRRDNEILLGTRMNTGFADGFHALPAGHLEAGEAATQGMAREAREETAILIEPSDLILVHVMHHHTNAGRVALFFEATDWIGEVVNREPAKCAGWTWHSLDTLPEPIVPYIAEALRRIRGHVLYSEGGWNELQHSGQSVSHDVRRNRVSIVDAPE